MKVKYKEVESISEFIDAVRIRVDVFIIEQKCEPGWEPDEEDKVSRHFIAIADGKVVSTLRIRELEDGIKIERMATRKEYRGMDIGRGLIEFVLKEIKKLKPKRIWMEAQVQAQGFYKKIGFKVISEQYDLWNTGILHIKMEYLTSNILTSYYLAVWAP